MRCPFVDRGSHRAARPSHTRSTVSCIRGVDKQLQSSLSLVQHLLVAARRHVAFARRISRLLA